MILEPLRVISGATLLAAVIGLAGCTPAPDAAAPQTAASGPGTAASGPAANASAPPGPPVSVTTSPARQRDFVLTLEAIGTATPVTSVDIKAQTSGVITKVHVNEGQFVRAGQALFTLDSRNDEANVAKMRAQMAKDEATLSDAKRQLARSRDLQSQNFVSQGAVDAAQTQVEALTATVQADLAALQAAQVSLSYSRIVAPGSGRVGSVNAFAGSSVQANVTSLLTLTQINPIDVTFSLPQRYLGDVLKALDGKSVNVNARLPEGGQMLSGRLQFVDNAVDAATGTVKVKARFDNPESKLWPGVFVNVSLQAATLPNVTVIPTNAVIQSQRGSIVYVADKGRAALRPVKVLAVQGEDSAVEGIKAGERVVLDGRQNLRPGSGLVERSTEGNPKGGAKPVAP
jgi:RND family efflux transporter MFP subunit